MTITEAVDFGQADLVPDADRPGGWTLLLDGMPQSHVDASMPTRLEFEYMRRLASVVDASAPAGQPLNVLHLGGGALALARYVAATRPGSRQLVVDHDAALMGLIRRVLPLPRRCGVKVRAGDAGQVLRGLGSDRYHMVIVDVPQRVHVSQLARVLRPHGCVAVNLIDRPPLSVTRGQVAMLRSVFGQVCLMAQTSVLRGRRAGNVVLAASDALMLDSIAAATSRDIVPIRLLHGRELDRFVAGARMLRDFT